MHAAVGKACDYLNTRTDVPMPWMPPNVKGQRHLVSAARLQTQYPETRFANHGLKSWFKGVPCDTPVRRDDINHREKDACGSNE